VTRPAGRRPVASGSGSNGGVASVCMTLACRSWRALDCRCARAADLRCAGHCLSAASKSATRTSPHGAGLEPPAPAARRHETGDDAILDLDGAMAALQWGWRTRAGLRAAAYGSGRTRGSCGRNPPRLHPEVAACEVVGDGAAAVIRDSSSSTALPPRAPSLPSSGCGTSANTSGRASRHGLPPPPPPPE